MARLVANRVLLCDVVDAEPEPFVGLFAEAVVHDAGLSRVHGERNLAIEGHAGLQALVAELGYPEIATVAEGAQGIDAVLVPLHADAVRDFSFRKEFHEHFDPGLVDRFETGS